MFKRKRSYRLYVSGELVAQGDADFLAEILQVKPDTLQHYGYAKSCPPYIKLEPLPMMYTCKKTMLTIDELESSLGVDRHRIWMAISGGKAICGHMVRKYEYPNERLVPDARVREMTASERASIRKGKAGVK